MDGRTDAFAVSVLGLLIFCTCAGTFMRSLEELNMGFMEGGALWWVRYCEPQWNSSSSCQWGPLAMGAAV
jgi:hypothetical protein